MQLNHYNTNFESRQFPITVVCENVTNAPNIGSMFRTADAFGVERIIFCGNNIPMGRKMLKTSRATEKTVPFETSDSIVNVVSDLIKDNYQIIVLEITSKSKGIHKYEFSKEKPIALIVGGENFGVSESILNQSSEVIHIQMYGQNSSMNVVQATTIALYEMTKQLM